MGGNDSIRVSSYFGFDPRGYMLGEISGFYTRSLRYNPGNIWAARDWTQGWQTHTYLNSFPYGHYYNFSGTPRYVVQSQYDIPYSTALGLQGYNPYGYQENPFALFYSIATENSLKGEIKITGSKINSVQSIMHQCAADEKAMKDNADLKAEAEQLEKEAKELAEEFEKVLANEARLTPDYVYAKVSGIKTKATALEEKAKGVLKKYEEVLKKLADEADAAAEAARQGNGDEGAGDAGRTGGGDNNGGGDNGGGDNGGGNNGGGDNGGGDNGGGNSGGGNNGGGNAGGGNAGGGNAGGGNNGGGNNGGGAGGAGNAGGGQGAGNAGAGMPDVNTVAAAPKVTVVNSKNEVVRGNYHEYNGKIYKIVGSTVTLADPSLKKKA